MSILESLCNLNSWMEPAKKLSLSHTVSNNSAAEAPACHTFSVWQGSELLAEHAMSCVGAASDAFIEEGCLAAVKRGVPFFYPIVPVRETPQL